MSQNRAPQQNNLGECCNSRAEVIERGIGCVPCVSYWYRGALSGRLLGASESRLSNLPAGDERATGFQAGATGQRRRSWNLPGASDCFHVERIGVKTLAETHLKDLCPTRKWTGCFLTRRVVFQNPPVRFQDRVEQQQMGYNQGHYVTTSQAACLLECPPWPSHDCGLQAVAGGTEGAPLLTSQA